MRHLCVAALLAGCSGNPAPHVATFDRLTIEVYPEPAGIALLVDGKPAWTSRRGDRGAPYGFAATGAIAATTEEQFGSYKFTESDPGWHGIDRLGDITDTATGLTFTLREGDRAVGTGTITVANLHVSIALATTTGEQMAIAAACTADEHFTGLGGQSFDVDHRGQTVPLWVQEDGIGKEDVPDDRYEGVWFLTGRKHSTHTPMPMMLSSAHYALVVDSDARSTFELCSDAHPDTARFSTWQPAITVELFLDDTARGALAQMIAWVGKSPRPPLHAFFPWVDAIFGSANVRRVAQKLRDNQISAAAIWTEDWHGGRDTATGYALKENWRVDRTLYPDFEAVADDLHAAGFAFLTYFNTFVDDTADVYAEATTPGYAIHKDGATYEFTGVAFGGSTLLDLTNPAAVTWAKGVLGENIAQGADGWMADFAEWLPVDATLASGADPHLDHDRYPIQWARLNRELLKPIAGRPDPIFFMRSAWLHGQADAMVIWSGDQQTDWSVGDGLPSVIPMGIGLGITGFPYFGGDIAGYMSQGTVPTSEELFYRWTAFGAFQPVMRTHHGRSARDNFQWEHDAGSIAHFRRWTRFHAQLAAYLWGSIGSYEQSGLPLLRLVALEFPDEPWAWTATDEYLLGDRILVAPIQVQGATTRDVMLPAGSWYPLFGGASLAGGTATATASTAEIPVYAPAGTLLALYPDGTQTPLPAITDDREVWLYPGDALDPARAVWSDAGGPTGTPTLTWAGRPATAGAPASAVFEGAPTPITVGTGFVTVTVVGDGHVTFAGGGTLAIARGNPTATTTVRLYTP